MRKAIGILFILLALISFALMNVRLELNEALETIDIMLETQRVIISTIEYQNDALLKLTEYLKCTTL